MTVLPVLLVNSLTSVGKINLNILGIRINLIHCTIFNFSTNRRLSIAIQPLMLLRRASFELGREDSWYSYLLHR